MRRPFRTLNVLGYRFTSIPAGLALLACCLGQTCNVNTPADTSVLASTPDAPDESADSTSDTVESYSEASVDETAAKRLSSQQMNRIIDASERDTITVDYSSLRSSANSPSPGNR